MKEVIIAPVEPNTINLSDVSESLPIFVKEKGRLVGMVVHEDKGWIIRIGGSFGATGHHDTIERCLTSSHGSFRYTFFIED